METNAIRVYEGFGQSIWYDNIRRGLLRSGELARLVREGVRGVTSNPTIFEKAISGSTDYDEALRRLVAEAASVEQVYFDLVVQDIREGADVLRSTYESSEGGDGYISVEVSPKLARDPKGTVSEALKLHKSIGRDNLMIKVPATSEGSAAITELIGQAISVNVTLIFGIAQYEKVAEAYIAGLERLDEAGEPLDGVSSVASFFVSRVDSAVDRALEEKGGPDAQKLLGQIAIANAKAAYQKYEEIFGGERFAKLRDHGARPQRLLWASTSTKNPNYKDTLYVDALIGKETVNTTPPGTLVAFQDHGELAPALEQGHPKSNQQLDALGALGIDLDSICSELLEQGLKSFADSMERLLGVIEARREALLEQTSERQRISLGASAAPVLDTLKSLGKKEAPRRLWSIDPSLFTSDPDAEESIKNRLGWLHSPEVMRDHVDDLTAFARKLSKEGFRKALLLGMGGSSLCPEVLATTYGTTPGFLELRVLDSTDPAAVRDALEWTDPKTTAYVVASKSGSTIEVQCFEAFFWEKAGAVLGDETGAHFMAISDPGSALVTMAAEKGYRRVFENAADIGGRYSAISFFGLVPAALIGADVDALVDDGERMAVGCASVVPADDNPGVRLGAFVGGLARSGRDKLTIIASPEVETLGSWIEQLVAESTGKQGKGVVPIDLEPLGSPDDYGDDRAFVYVRYGGRKPSALDKKVDALIGRGHPVAQIGMLAKHDLGGEFFRWETATAVMGSVLGVNPFDEPNVTEAKNATGAIIEAFEKSGKLPDIASVKPGGADVAKLLDSVSSGDYVVLSLYAMRTDERAETCARIREQIRRRTRAATTLGYGPRFLHSTGQLHKGGGNNGVFIVLTADAPDDVDIPGRKYSFGVLRDAQALGDLEVLRKRDRRVIRVHLGSDVEGGLREIEKSLSTD